MNTGRHRSTHHSRKYARHHIMLADEFLKQVVDRGEASRLGDRAWVSAAVDRLSREPAVASRARKSVVKEILDGCLLSKKRNIRPYQRRKMLSRSS